MQNLTPVLDGANRVYSDSNPPETLMMTEYGGAVATPAAGQVVLYSTDGSALLMKDDAGVVRQLGGGTKVSALAAATALGAADTVPLVQGGSTKKASVAQVRNTVTNASIAAQGAGFAADTYLTGSFCQLASDQAVKAGSWYRVKFYVTKTAAGVATPIITVRTGTAGTTADTARTVLTFAAQTAVADTGMIELFCNFRTVGSGTTATLYSTGMIDHALASTGFSTANTSLTATLSSGFDSTTANLGIGISVNGGTSAAWTVQLVEAELQNLA